MSASKTNLFSGIILALKAMWKTCTNLSNRVEKIEALQETQQKKNQAVELQMELIIKQHLDIVDQIKHISMLQADIAKQIISQHEETEQLYKALGLKKDLAYYSFNTHQEEGH